MHFPGHERTYTFQPDEEVCNCIQVLRHEIQTTVDEGATTVTEVGDICGAGGGCGECHPEIARLIHQRVRPDLRVRPGMQADEAILTVLGPLAHAIGAAVQIKSHDQWELVLKVEGDAEKRQTIALWAELLIDPLLGSECFLEVE